MLQTGMSIAFKSSGILNVLCKVRPLVKSVAAIPLNAVANAILDLILARIRLIKKVLPVPPGIAHLPHSYQPWNKSNCVHHVNQQ